MPRERTLLERLRRGEQPGSPSATENTSELIRSIQANLARLLNARLDHAAAQPDYGVPPPADIVYSFPSSVTDMQRRIRDCIQKYEPRLKDVEVIHVENDDKQLVLRYQLRARLATSNTQSWINFTSRMDPSGRMSLRS